MKLAASCLLLSIAMIVSSTTAQVTASVGPAVAPVGCPIKITLCNDTPGVVGTGACFYSVATAAGTPVYNPFICILIIIPIGPNSTYTKEWPQVSHTGAAIVPGNYVVTVTLPNGNGQSTHPITIVPATGNDAAVTSLGTLRPGITRNFDLWAPSHAFETYVLVASATANFGTPTCAGMFPLDFDFLFQMSLTPNTVFINSTGFLDGNGRTTAPFITIPPWATGIAFNVGFATIDVLQPCPVTGWSAAEPILTL